MNLLAQLRSGFGLRRIHLPRLIACVLTGILVGLPLQIIIPSIITVYLLVDEEEDPETNSAEAGVYHALRGSVSARRGPKDGATQRAWELLRTGLSKPITLFDDLGSPSDTFHGAGINQRC